MPPDKGKTKMELNRNAWSPLLWHPLILTTLCLVSRINFCHIRCSYSSILHFKTELSLFNLLAPLSKPSTKLKIIRIMFKILIDLKYSKSLIKSIENSVISAWFFKNQTLHSKRDLLYGAQRISCCVPHFVMGCVSRCWSTLNVE